MNILFITVSYPYPENDNMYADLLREFTLHNHHAYVICARQRRERKKTELLCEYGIHVLRIKTGNITGEVSLFEKGIETIRLDRRYISGIKNFYGNIKFDLLIYATPPVVFQKTLSYVIERDNAKCCHLVKDIFPQSAVDLGLLSCNGVIHRYFRSREKALYMLDDLVGCTSDRNINYILQHNPEIDKSKVFITRNSINPRPVSTFVRTGEMRRNLNIREEDVVFLFGGNLGKPQAIPLFLDFASRLCQNERCHVIIAGRGTEVSLIQNYLLEKPQERLHYLEFLPKNEYDQLVAECDVGLIFLDHRYTVPNNPMRFTEYLEASMPILAATDMCSDLEEWLNHYHIGFWVESKPHRMDELIEKALLLASDPELRRLFGRNARELLEKEFTSSITFQTIMDRLKIL